MAEFSVLFICMGNICRSPTAEGVLKQMLVDEGLADRVFVDSAGTIAYHSGEPADARMRQFAAKRGYQLDSIARQTRAAEVEKFDLLLTMDRETIENVRRLDRGEKYHDKIRNFCEFCEEHTDKEVPDPYYGGDAGFEHVMDLIEDGCTQLVKMIKRKLAI